MKTLRRIATVLLLGIIVLSMSIALAQGGLNATIRDGARLRGGPGTDWAWIGSVEAGEVLLLDGRAPGGGWVRGVTSSGIVGWVIQSAIDLTEDQVNTLPAIWVDVPFTLAPVRGGAIPDSQKAELGLSGATAPAAPVEGQTAAPVSAPAAVAAPSGDGPAITVGNFVRLRNTPSTDGQIIAELPPGTNARANGRNANQDWIRITLGDGRSGWVSLRFVPITPEDFATLPITDAPGSGAAPAAAPAAGEPAAEIPIPEAIVNVAPVSGFNLGGHINGFGQATLNALQRAGMSWVKKQFRYTAGQNPQDAAGVINEAHAYGYRILLGVVGAPSEVLNPGYFDQYAGFVAGLAALGADAIEIWNEPNIDREWPAGSIDGALYTDLLRRSYNAIKGANPNTLVISGAPAPTGFFGEAGCTPQGCNDNAFLAAMARAGAASVMDCVGAHYNEGILPPTATSGDPRGNSGYYTRYFSGMLNTYYNAFGGRRPICWTELGYLSPEGISSLPEGFIWAAGVTVGQHAAWLDQAASLSARSGKVRLMIVWNVDFPDTGGSDPMGGYAMIRPDGSCPACDALGS
ncbi:MAG TPA: SH3 domain-containing protein [Aggregatilineales bacterium]|nr:SH3 domain-containing protein [Aggregatilineales bacterium]